MHDPVTFLRLGNSGKFLIEPAGTLTSRSQAVLLEAGGRTPLQEFGIQLTKCPDIGRSTIGQNVQVDTIIHRDNIEFQMMFIRDRVKTVG